MNPENSLTSAPFQDMSHKRGATIGMEHKLSRIGTREKRKMKIKMKMQKTESGNHRMKVLYFYHCMTTEKGALLS